MNANQYIQKLKDANPKLFKAKQFKLTPSAFEVNIRHAFAEGEIEGRARRSSRESEVAQEIKAFFGR